MCDTLYARPAGAAGQAWFAKNSDRHPEEPQTLCLVPRRNPAPAIAVGEDRIAAADRGFAFALSKPSWMPGGEMGLNERGVAIGNEAVFSRHHPKADGILGMAILRAALAHAGSAAEARDFICSFTEANDQGGNGAYKGSLVYSNSYIVSDPQEAFVVETAGRRWAWKAAGARASISNAYSIEGDFGGIDAATRSELDAGRGGPGRSWRRAVEDRFYLLFTRADRRRACTGAALARGAAFGLEGAMAALRSHGEDGTGGPGMGHPCLHEEGFPFKNTSTASMVVEYLPPGGRAQTILWFTGTPYPCLSLFVPVLLTGGAFRPLWSGQDYAEGAADARARWEAHRVRTRAKGGARLSADAGFRVRRDDAQRRLVATARGLVSDGPSDATLAAACKAVDGTMSDWEAFVSG